jgi:protein gp37
MNNNNDFWINWSHDFWTGNHLISAGSKNKCGMGEKIRKVSSAKFKSPMYLDKPKWILVCPDSDFFIEEADTWRASAWKVIENTPQHMWIIITERPERIKKHLPPNWDKGYQNVMLGVSISEQMYFDRAVVLSKIPARRRLIHSSPLLEQLNFLEIRDGRRIIDAFHWVILGGESFGPRNPFDYRPTNLDWMDDALFTLKHQTNTKVFIEQLGGHIVSQLRLNRWNGDEMEEWPSYLRTRQFPV